MKTMLFIAPEFSWWFVLIIAIFMIIAHIIAIPHLLMFKPRWSAKFLDRYFGQNVFLFDIYKKERRK